MVEKDYLGVGTIFGDLAFLTGGFKRCTVTCETVVQVCAFVALFSAR